MDPKLHLLRQKNKEGIMNYHKALARSNIFCTVWISCSLKKVIFLEKVQKKLRPH